MPVEQPATSLVQPLPGLRIVLVQQMLSSQALCCLPEEAAPVVATPQRRARLPLKVLLRPRLVPRHSRNARDVGVRGSLPENPSCGGVVK